MAIKNLNTVAVSNGAKFQGVVVANTDWAGSMGMRCQATSSLQWQPRLGEYPRMTGPDADLSAASAVTRAGRSVRA